MYSLLLDSSNYLLCIGLAKDGEVFDYLITDKYPLRQSEFMVKEISDMLDKHHISREQIEDVVVTIGPGSYTGTRIALSIAKVMCLVLHIPLYAVSSLHSLKKKDEPTISLINARSGRYYIGVYQGENIILKDTIMTNDEVDKYIKEHPDYFVSESETKLGPSGEPKVNIILEMNSLKNVATKYDDPIGVKPIYLKDY